MSKINVKTITPVAIANLSDYQVAVIAQVKIRNKYRELLDSAEEELQKIKDARKKALEEGQERDAVIVKYDTTDAEAKITALEVARKNELKPYQESINTVLKMIDKDFYPAYCLYQKTANVNASGDIEIGSGDKVTKYTIGKDKTFMAICREFLRGLGCSYLDNEKDMKKATNAIVVWTSGQKLDNKTGGLKDRTKSDARNVLVRACIKFLVEQGAIKVADDGKITKVEKKAEEVAA